MKCTQQLSLRPYFVYDNIDSMNRIREICGFSIKHVSTQTLIPQSALRDYEYGTAYPGKTNYNKLAAFFDWEAWL